MTLFWRENIKSIDSDKRDCLQKDQAALIDAIRPALKSVRVGRETYARPTCEDWSVQLAKRFPGLHK